ncbi:hypothetical protein [uncultured Clostridium sp.]|uniref:hypothetical protein n=1 Tax=uncultured Clostridium sp. TaxID=59620 RepID=UPI0025F08812|nr:hypothetical protein [uncultured Clostridium sp.]
MKKKLLSLVLAGAMVASTSVSAFAATEDATYNIDSTSSQNHKVTITGDVANQQNETLPSTITVTIPTAMAFKVDKDGTVSGGKIEVVNKSNESVEVVAEKFSDSTPDSNIVLVKKSELNNKIEQNDGKRYMTLDLVGETNTVGLVSDTNDSATGFVKDSDESEITTSTKTTLGNAVNGSSLELKLIGNAKHSDSSQHPYSAPTTAVNDTFNLILKIQKTK